MRWIIQRLKRKYLMPEMKNLKSTIIIIGKIVWVPYKRNSYLHLANTTDNCLESHNQKLKDLTQRPLTLREMFQNVIYFSQVYASEYSQAVFTEEFTMVSKFNKDVAGVKEIRNNFNR